MVVVRAPAAVAAVVEMTDAIIASHYGAGPADVTGNWRTSFLSQFDSNA